MIIISKGWGGGLVRVNKGYAMARGRDKGDI